MRLVTKSPTWVNHVEGSWVVAQENSEIVECVFFFYFFLTRIEAGMKRAERCSVLISGEIAKSRSPKY